MTYVPDHVEMRNMCQRANELAGRADRHYMAGTNRRHTNIGHIFYRRGSGKYEICEVIDIDNGQAIIYSATRLSELYTYVTGMLDGMRMATNKVLDKPTRTR